MFGIFFNELQSCVKYFTNTARCRHDWCHVPGCRATTTRPSSAPAPPATPWVTRTLSACSPTTTGACEEEKSPTGLKRNDMWSKSTECAPTAGACERIFNKTEKRSNFISVKFQEREMSWDVSMTKMIKDCDKNDNVDININIAIQIRFQEILQNTHCRRHTEPIGWHHNSNNPHS